MHGKRRTAREMALQMLYQHELGESPLVQIFKNFDRTAYLRRSAGTRRTKASGTRRKREVEEGFEYATALVRGTVEHQEEIDRMIQDQADNWRLERMPAVDRNILRLAVYEILFEQDVPKLVVVDEAIELAKQYGSEQSSRFVNGLLDGLLKEHEFPGRMT